MVILSNLAKVIQVRRSVQEKVKLQGAGMMMIMMMMMMIVMVIMMRMRRRIMRRRRKRMMMRRRRRMMMRMVDINTRICLSVFHNVIISRSTIYL